MEAPIPNKMNTESEAAEKLGVPVSTLRHWRQSGGGPTYYKVGRGIRYSDEALAAFLETAKREPVEDARGAA